MEKKLYAVCDTHVPGLGNFKKGQEVKSKTWAAKLEANQDFELVAEKKSKKGAK